MTPAIALFIPDRNEYITINGKSQNDLLKNLINWIASDIMENSETDEEEEIARTISNTKVQMLSNEREEEEIYQIDTFLKIDDCHSDYFSNYEGLVDAIEEGEIEFATPDPKRGWGVYTNDLSKIVSEIYKKHPDFPLKIRLTIEPLTEHSIHPLPKLAILRCPKCGKTKKVTLKEVQEQIQFKGHWWSCDCDYWSDTECEKRHGANDTHVYFELIDINITTQTDAGVSHNV